MCVCVGGGGVPLAKVQINTFQVGDEVLIAPFVTYSTHQGVLSAFRFNAPLQAHYYKIIISNLLNCL